jgi:hypothetical protein
VGRGIAVGVVIVVAVAASVLLFSPAVPRLRAATSIASPTSAHDYGTVPAGVSLIYGAEPSNALWLTAYDWGGTARGTLKLPGPLTQELLPESHCFVLQDQQNFDEVLYVDVPGQPLNRRVGVIAHEPDLGQVGVEAVECNFKRDLAIAVRTAVGTPSDAWALRLSDASILGHWSYDRTLSVVPSTDGSLLAENGANGGVTRIRSIPDGAVLAKLPAIDAVNAFSDDNRLVVIGPVVSVAQIRVLDWRTGNEVWHNGNAGWTMRVAVNPGTGDLAIAIGTEEQYHSLTQDTSYALVIVHPDGSVAEIPGRRVWILPPYADGYYPYKGGPP